MFGWGELAVVLLIALILLGPEKITEIARVFGKLYAEYRKAKRMIELEMVYGRQPISDEELEKNRQRKYEEIGIELTKDQED
ncbi:sec-independent translocation protein MttA [Archaeoglobales archaeon ex4484_92]|nr:MAG: sec-independent translocation protein MttA [Archaeoglobales archaeon ex4484_92]